MAITQVGSAVIPTGNPTTGFTCGIGSGVQTNDILIISITNRDATTDPTVTDNDTGGNTWAKLGGGATGLSVWWKRATSATASKTVTVGSCTGSSSGVLTAWRGASVGAVPYEAVTTESNGSGDETHAAITTSRAGCWVFLCIANRTNDLATDTQSATSPAVITELGEKLSTGGSDCSNTQCAAEKASAGSTGTISWGQTDAASISCAFSLLPALTPLTAEVGTFTETGNAANLTVQRGIAAATGVFTETGNSASLSVQRGIAADTGVFVETGNAAGLTVQRKLSVDTGAFVETGQDVGLNRGFSIAVDTGVFTETGNDAGLSVQRGISAATGAFVETGNAAGLTAQRKLSLAAGVFVETGIDVGLNRGFFITVDTGAFDETGNDATLTVGRKLFADTGVFAETGNDAGLTAQRKLSLDAGSFILTGIDVILEGPADGATLTAETGTFTETGNTAGLTVQRRMAAETGSFTETGNAADLRAQRKLSVDTGTFTETGQDVSLRRGYYLSLDTGAFTETCNDAALTRQRRLMAGTGVFEINASAALEGVPEPPPALLGLGRCCGVTIFTGRLPTSRPRGMDEDLFRRLVG